MSAPAVIRRAETGPADARGLADVLVDCVEGGASVGFMLPITRERALSGTTASVLTGNDPRP